MRVQLLVVLSALALLLSACAEQQVSKPRVPEKGDPAYFKVRDSMADQVYVNEDPAKKGWIDTVRRIYIAPVNTSRTQIVQPHGVDKSDLDAWEMTAEEEQVINSKFAREMTRALEADQAFHVVGNPAEAQAELHAKLIAIHPYQPRSVVESGGKGGGAVTMSFALVDPADNAVMIRALDSKSTDNIWAFHNMKTEMTALDLIFGLWGHQVRRSILFLQGRLDSAPPPILLKPQQ